MLTSRRRKAPWYRSPKLLRHGVMVFFFLVLLRVAVRHLVEGGGPQGTPSPEAYCPLGGLASLYQLLTTGGFIRHIHPSNVILFGAVVLLTLVAARGFCGWICPFGSVQEWIGLLGKKIFRKKFNPTGAWDRYLRYLKYVILVVIIALTWHTGSLVFRDYDPFLAFFRLGEDMEKTAWAYGALAVILIGSLIIDRFFCKYACPLGALLGLIAKIGFTKIARNPQDCTDCNLCFKKCNAHVDLLSSTSIRSAECNQCMDCVVDCPLPGVLNMRVSRWRFSHLSFAAVLLAGMGGLVGITMITGDWEAKANKVVLADASGKLHPESIRGWMTLQDISEYFSLPIEQLYEDNGIPKDIPAATRLNRVHSDYEVEFEPDTLREYVRQRLAGVSAGDTARQGLLLSQAEGPSASPRRQSGPIVRDRESGGLKRRDSTEPREHDPNDPNKKEGEGQVVKGRMTLNEIARATGVSKGCLLGILELPDSVNPRVSIRDWMHEHDLAMKDVREAVEACQKKDQ